MIIFNPLAIPVAMVVALLWGLTEWLAPTWADGAYGALTFFSIAFVVSAGCELVGLAGRLFFVPMWFLSLLGVGYQSWSLWGATGAIVAGGLLVAGVGVMLWLGGAARNEWEEASEKLREAQRAFKSGETDKLWSLLNDAYCTTFSDKYEPQQAAHNAKVLDLLFDFAGARLSPGHLSYATGVRQQFRQAALSKVPYELEAGAADWVATLIEGAGTTDEAPPVSDQAA